MNSEKTKKNLNLQTSDFRFQKGIALFLMVLIMSLILAIGLGISAILIEAIKIMEKIGYSVIAFYAADHGMEMSLYSLYHHSPPIAEHSGRLDDTYYQTFIKCCNPNFKYCAFGGPEEPVCPLGPDHIDLQCHARYFCLKSLGSYKGVKRAIQINH